MEYFRKLNLELKSRHRLPFTEYANKEQRKLIAKELNLISTTYGHGFDITINQ